jgi:hypothetical protein
MLALCNTFHFSHDPKATNNTNAECISRDKRAHKENANNPPLIGTQFQNTLITQSTNLGMCTAETGRSLNRDVPVNMADTNAQRL